MQVRVTQVEALYAEHTGYLDQLAAITGRKTGVAVDELKGEARLWFMKAYESCPASVPFKKWLGTVVRNGLISFVRKQDMLASDGQQEAFAENASHRLTAHDTVAFHEDLDALSPGAKEIVSILLNCPAELAEELSRLSPNAVRGRLRQILQEQYGWSWRYILSAYREIREMLRETKRHDHEVARCVNHQSSSSY